MVESVSELDYRPLSVDAIATIMIVQEKILHPISHADHTTLLELVMQGYS